MTMHPGDPREITPLPPLGLTPESSSTRAVICGNGVAEEIRQGGWGIGAAGAAPQGEFGDVHPPVGGFAVVHP